MTLSPLAIMRDRSGGAEEPEKTGLTPTASLNVMSQSEKAEVLKKT